MFAGNGPNANNAGQTRGVTMRSRAACLQIVRAANRKAPRMNFTE